MMTQQEQQIALAEWDGWTQRDNSLLNQNNPEKLKWYWTNPKGCSDDVPNYPSDLNAVRELELKLSSRPPQDGEESRSMYLRILAKVTGDYGWEVTTATASQRCEALCRVLWPERWLPGHMALTIEERNALP